MLPCCWRLLVNADAALSSSLHPPLHDPLRAMGALLLCYAVASGLVSAESCSLAAACGSQPTHTGGLLAPGCLPFGPLAAFCTSLQSPGAALVLRASE